MPWALSLRIALAAALVAVLVAAYGKGRHDGAAMAEARHSAALVAAQATAVAKQKEMKADVERIAEDQWQRAQDLQGRLAVADRALVGLRGAVAAADRAGAARAASGDDAAAAARALLAECSGELVAVAGVADRLAVQLGGLQAYVRVVTAGR